MARDPQVERIDRLEKSLDNVQRALGRQTKITAELRASHSLAMKAIQQLAAKESPDLSVVLASMRPPDE